MIIHGHPRPAERCGSYPAVSDGLLSTPRRGFCLCGILWGLAIQAFAWGATLCGHAWGVGTHCIWGWASQAACRTLHLFSRGARCKTLGTTRTLCGCFTRTLCRLVWDSSVLVCGVGKSGTRLGDWAGHCARRRGERFAQNRTTPHRTDNPLYMPPNSPLLLRPRRQGCFLTSGSGLFSDARIASVSAVLSCPPAA